MNLVNNSKINGGSSKEDTLVASFSAAQDQITFEAYNHDGNNKMFGEYRNDKFSPSNRVFHMERTTEGVKDANSGYYLNLSDILTNVKVKLDPGCRYQFE